MCATHERGNNMEDVNETQDTQATEPAEGKTYTQEEVNALLQQEADRRVTQALKKAQEKNDKAVKEAAKLARMDESQRYQYELEQREKAIADKERELAVAENKAVASSVLANRGLSPDLVALVVAEDADTMNGNINLLEKAFKASVKAEVEKRLASTTPKKNLPMDNVITRESFRAMPLHAQAQLKQEQPELYKSLTS